MTMHLALPNSVASAADGVAMYCGEGGYCNQTADTLEAFEAAGATPVEEIETFGSLSDYRVLIVMSPRDGLSAASVEALTSFAADPERWLVLVGDRPEAGFEPANTAINDVLVALGKDGAMQLDAQANVGEVACAAPADEVVPGHPLLEGVAFIDTNRSTRIDVGTADTLVVDGGNVVLAAADNIVLSSDSNIFAEGCGFEADGNLRLFSNLYTVPPPAPVDDGSTGTDDGGSEGSGAADGGTSDPDDSGNGTDGGDDGTAGTGDGLPAMDGEAGDGCGCTSAPPGPGAVAGLALLGLGLLRRRTAIHPA